MQMLYHLWCYSRLKPKCLFLLSRGASLILGANLWASVFGVALLSTYMPIILARLRLSCSIPTALGSYVQAAVAEVPNFSGNAIQVCCLELDLKSTPGCTHRLGLLAQHQVVTPIFLSSTVVSNCHTMIAKIWYDGLLACNLLAKKQFSQRKKKHNMCSPLKC